jgi:hypothetical protein
MTDIKSMIKNLIGIEVQTDDLAVLRLDPAQHTATQEDAEKLQDLFLLMDLTDEMEAEKYDE